LKGIYQGLAGHPVHLVGAATLGGFQITGSFVFDGRSSATHTATAVVMPSSLTAHSTIMHGCIPASAFMVITRIEGTVVYELDGRPALDVLQEMVGQSLPRNRPILTVTLGEKHGDLYTPYDEAAYLNRFIMNANPDDGSLVLFEADFKAGAKVQIMSRDNQRMLESVQTRTRQLLSTLADHHPVFGLYVDCAGRTSAFSGAEKEDGAILQAEVGNQFPILGFYSGGEIAPLFGLSRPLNWTGVLTLFTLEESE
jgi:hypothetical protein